MNSIQYAESLLKKYEEALPRLEQAIGNLKGLPDVEVHLKGLEGKRDRYQRIADKVSYFRDRFQETMETPDNLLGIRSPMTQEGYLKQEYPALYGQMANTNGRHNETVYRWNPVKTSADVTEAPKNIGVGLVRQIADVASQLGEYTMSDINTRFSDKGLSTLYRTMKHLNDHGFSEIIKRGKGKKLDDSIKNEAIRRIKAGENPNRVASAMGISPPSAYKFAHEINNNGYVEDFSSNGHSHNGTTPVNGNKGAAGFVVGPDLTVHSRNLTPGERRQISTDFMDRIAR